MYEVGDKVWVKCAESDCWVAGIVVGVTQKRVRVFNEVRGIEGLYAHKNVERV